MKKFFKILLIIVCIINIILSGYYLLNLSKNNKESDNVVQGAVDSLITEKVNDEEALKEKYRKEYPDVDFPDNLLLKYYPLYAKNQDLRGWISIPEFEFEYPIVQGKDNSYYLKKDINKEYNTWGNPFFSCNNKFDPIDKNLIIFGHNSANYKNKMFTPLNKYLTLEGFIKAPVIECDTIYEKMYWKIYAVFITNSDKKDDNGNIFYYIKENFDNTESFVEYINEINKRAIYYTGVDICEEDNILTISTCNYSFKNARAVIVCRKVRPGESMRVSTAIAQNNSSPMYPQAWYDAKKLQNPYK